MQKKYSIAKRSRTTRGLQVSFLDFLQNVFGINGVIRGLEARQFFAQVSLLQWAYFSVNG